MEITVYKKAILLLLLLGTGSIAFTQPNEKKIKVQYDKARGYLVKSQYDSSSYILFKIIDNVVNEKSPYYPKALILQASIYSGTEKFKLAEQFLNRSLKYTSDSLLIEQIYGNLGQLWYQASYPKKGLGFYQKSLRFNSDKKSLSYQITVSNIGSAYTDLKQLDSALIYVKRSHQLAVDLKDTIGISIAVNNLATIYRDLNQNKEALKYYHQALVLAEKTESKEEKRIILLNLSQLYEKIGETEKAYSFYKSYVDLKEQIFNAEMDKNLVDALEKYRTSKRKRQLAELKLKSQQKDAKHKRQIFLTIIIGIGFVILLLTIIIWLRWKSIQQRNRAHLEVITATLNGEEKQRIKIAQELHDELGGLLGITRMLFTKSKKLFTENSPELFERIDSILLEANNRTRSISHDLFSPTLKQFGLQPAIKEQIANIKFSNPDLEINLETEEFRLEPELELNCFRICTELFTNTIKYANATAIQLQIVFRKEGLQLIYADNGVGFDPSKVTKGVGLNSIEARVKSYDGNLVYTSNSNGFGVEINFKITSN